MKSRKHDSMMNYLLSQPEDYYRNDDCESLRDAVEGILRATRSEAYAACNSSTVWEMWPEGDEEGIRYKVNQILNLLRSRTATGSVEDFLLNSGTLHQHEYVAVTIWDLSRRSSSPHSGESRCVTQIYHRDELPDHYQTKPIPYVITSGSGMTAIRPVFTLGVGD